MSSLQIEPAPELLRVDEPKKISFSQLLRAERCTFSGLSRTDLQVSHSFPIEKLGRSQLIGVLLHSILESISKSKERLQLSDFQKLFNQQLELIAAKSIFTPKDIMSWVEVGKMYRSLYEKVANPIKNRGDSKFQLNIEKVFQSEDGTLIGRIDLLVLKDDAPWLLAEFKSAQFFDSKNIKLDYIQQLHFYSELIKDTFKHYPLSLQLVHPGENPVDIHHDPVLSQNIVYRARMVLDLMRFRLGQSFNNKKVFHPSTESCSRCPHRLVCPEFKNISGTIKLQGPNHIVWGYCESKYMECENNKSIRLKVLKGSLPFEELIILDFDVNNFPEFKNCSTEKIIITNLYYDYHSKVARFSPASQLLNWEHSSL